MNLRVAVLAHEHAFEGTALDALLLAECVEAAGVPPGVVNVVPGSSAWKNGLTTGDMLESINGVATRDMPLAYAEMLLSGDVGSSVEVSVLRVRKPEPQKVTLTRAIQRQPAITRCSSPKKRSSVSNRSSRKYDSFKYS